MKARLAVRGFQRESERQTDFPKAAKDTIIILCSQFNSGKGSRKYTCQTSFSQEQ